VADEADDLLEAVELQLRRARFGEVTRLEARLSTRLFNRSTRRLLLTPEGQAFYERSVRVLADMDEAERAASAGASPRGHLRINSNIPFGMRYLMPLVPLFMERNPDVTLDVILSDTVVDLMQERADITDAPGVTSTTSRELTGDIEFRDLNFSYNGVPVLHDINLHIPAGTSLAIVGPTGSGKTTLVSLIPRVYDAAPGSVLIDGKPVRDFALADLRRNIGFVPQETFLFSETIRENIAFGVQNATDQDVRWAANAANIAADIESFPDQYKTIVGERGITLSGGQKQRTAIARALIRNPRILVLDDALSSVDTQTEDRILNHLRDVMKGRTTIFISHRVSTVRNADRIAVLHGGRIVELGTHEELLTLNGYYTDLYNKQLLEEELAEV